MMTYVKEEIIRSAAVEYVRRQLAQGKSLARHLTENIDFGQGDILILTPAPLNQTEMTQFDWGHTPTAQSMPVQITIADASYMVAHKADVYDQLAEGIFKQLGDTGNVCLLENSLAQAQDPWLQRAKSLVITIGTDVYHMLSSADKDQIKIGDAIREAEHLPTFIGALGRVASDTLAQIASSKVLTTEQINDFAKTVHCIFIGAYDGEGYVVWNKTGRVE
jgi:hypothetical protein